MHPGTTALPRLRIALCGRGKHHAMNAVNRTNHLCTVFLATAALVATGVLGCHASHPDDRAAVYQALNQHDLASVEVSQDRGHGVITLRGIVGNQDSKNRAQQLTQQAAPGYTVQNQLTIDKSGLMSLANPSAKRPDAVEMAHPPANPPQK